MSFQPSKRRKVDTNKSAPIYIPPPAASTSTSQVQQANGNGSNKRGNSGKKKEDEEVYEPTITLHDLSTPGLHNYLINNRLVSPSMLDFESAIRPTCISQVPSQTSPPPLSPEMEEDEPLAQRKSSRKKIATSKAANVSSSSMVRRKSGNQLNKEETGLFDDLMPWDDEEVLRKRMVDIARPSWEKGGGIVKEQETIVNFLAAVRSKERVLKEHGP